jgi:exopolyphosphatase/guanosine-5'-triphosphate,3'-diphosphate pyrophosphatase
MRLAALDIGTNSVRLLVADKTGQGLQPQQRVLRTTRLGGGLVGSGHLSPAGKEATLSAVLEFKDLALSLGAAAILAVGTSALREAEDGRTFAAELAEAAGLQVQLLSPGEEAFFSYEGASGTLALPADALVFDLGGGSCELAWREDGVLQAHSMKIGAVYLTEAYFRRDPPARREVLLARREIRSRLADLRLAGKTPVGLGGTVTSLASIVAGLACYEPDRVHGAVLARTDVNKVLTHLLAVPVRERLKMSGLQASRADILPAGALVVEELLISCRADQLTVSEGDMLVGLLLHQH